MEATQAGARSAAHAPDVGLAAAADQPPITNLTADVAEQDHATDVIDPTAPTTDTSADSVDGNATADAGDGLDTSEVDDESDSAMEDADDVFAGILDEVPDSGGAAREEYLSIRGFTSIRQMFVQHIQGSPERPSTLGKLVSARQPRALLLYLLLLACEHRLGHNRRLPLTTVARMLTTAHYPCSSRQARLAIETLTTHKLVQARWFGASVEMVPLFENGSGQVWDAPTGHDEDPDLQRYFTIPNALFSDAVLDQLHLPGLAVLLVALKETSKTATFSISVERFAEWYGFSERTAERGYRELADAELMRAHRQFKKDSRMVRGVKAVYHRTLLGAFSTQERRDAQRVALNARRATTAKTRAKTATPPATTTEATVSAR